MLKKVKTLKTQDCVMTSDMSQSSQSLAFTITIQLYTQALFPLRETYYYSTSSVCQQTESERKKAKNVSASAEVRLG